LQDPDTGVRYFVAVALKSIGTPEALNAVKKHEELQQ
jgi:hypothetical protein